ncbi:MAG: tetratricopeptide repeat protein, partial [Bacillota bacterium]|nr:tetratricopeptide repeat protein [Bacillota bacterium]
PVVATAADSFLPQPSIWPETTQVFTAVAPVVPSIEPPTPMHEDNLRLYEKALAAYHSGRYTEAVALLQMICPESEYEKTRVEMEGNVSALMARILANQGNLDQAVEWCEKAITKDKINANHRFLLAIILMEQGQEKAAVQALKRTLYLRPDFIAAYYLLGTLALREKSHKDANRYFQQAISLISNVPKDETLTELDGMTAGRLRETIQRLMIEGGIIG